jgi:hypothetical protein
MIRISSGWTLVLRLFVPIFYTVFMIAWSVATIWAGDEVSPVFEHLFYKIGISIAFLVMLWIFYKTVWKLKRLDVSQEHLYITDYFKTFRYTVDSVDWFEQFTILGIPFLQIRLKEMGAMGHEMTILIERAVWNEWLSQQPSYATKMKGFS